MAFDHRPAWAALLLLLSFAAKASAELKVSGDTKVDRDRMARLTASGAPVGSAIVWDVDKEDMVDIEEMGERFIFVGPPGVYRVKCRALSVKDGRTLVETVRVTVTIVGKPDPIPPTPPPVPPTPDPPTPVPPPTPGGPLWVLIVEETADATARRGELFASKTLADRIKAKGHRWRVTDKDIKDREGKVPRDLAPWIEKAKAKKLPQMFLVAQDGTVLYWGDVPATAAGIVDELSRVGG